MNLVILYNQIESACWCGVNEQQKNISCIVFCSIGLYRELIFCSFLHYLQSTFELVHTVSFFHLSSFIFQQKNEVQTGCQW